MYNSKYLGEIDPENCSQEELKEYIEKLHNLSGYFETKQLALKTFINSVYGATASKYFVGHNTAVAESITLQGQDLNHYSENCVNKYFRGIFQSEEHYNRTIYVPIIDYAEKYPLEGCEFFMKDENKEWKNINVGEQYFEMIAKKTFDKDFKKTLQKIFVKTIFGKYLGITLEQAKSVDINKGRVTEQKPLTHKDILPYFKYFDKVSYLEDDITASLSIAGDTDSHFRSAFVYVDDAKMTIEEAFNKCKLENRDSILVLQKGQEIVPVYDHTTKTLNPNAPFIAEDRPMKYIMRHKVKKAKYKITSSTGKELIITGDHSIMVVRDGKLVSIPAKDINIETDKLIEIAEFVRFETNLVSIAKLEQLEDFDDEYVYDIEVDDTHTFFANDILAHNSIYVEFGRITNQLDIMDPGKATRFVVDLWNYGCGPYMDKCYETYAEKYNCDHNVQSLELEKVADTALMVAKKHYAMSECFLEPNIYVNIGDRVIYKGLEVIQGSTPPFARKCQEDFYKFILGWYVDHNYAPSFDTLYSMIKGYKEDFLKQKPDNICKTQSIGDYEKFVIDDRQGIAVNLHCPIHVKAAAIANFTLNKPENKTYKMKYNKIKTRDKVKFYKTTNPKFEVFAFLPGKFPLEYALPIDYNAQFADLILNPLNRIFEIVSYQPLTSDLCYTNALF